MRWFDIDGRDMRNCWVIGPIAWDWPYRLPTLPRSGGFVQGARLADRAGGTGANVARALASRGVAVSMVGYVGRDNWGELSRANLVDCGVDTTHVATVDGDTSQVLLLIEPSGERTIVGVVPDLMSSVWLDPTVVQAGDLVYLAAWRPQFAGMVHSLAGRDAVIASVPFPKQEEPLPISYVIGSRAEVPDDSRPSPWRRYCDWTAGRISGLILTLGSDGAMSIDADGERHFAAHRIDAVDATGAGDAFTAAILAAMMAGMPPLSGIEEGLLWGAAAACVDASIPPPWSEVVGRLL
ncbi:carbohydrate kinase family protein [Mycobacterium sp.]|uniref:carbohydrate kinase family protein n=1 Tax=Mycobacterium sp. TaxID=1785 RepID=UPI002C69E8EA|nr:carbohydrate kinase family protein [Mycobacterium sp.]HKP40097.1 carbohydrate kinase family protein [Mycobacterium sp.]